MKSIIAFFIISTFCLGKCLSQSPRVPALYVFGDSLVDNGNNNWLNVLFIAKANYNPYGVDYPGGTATGRVSNGKHTPDFIAEYLGLPPPERIKKPNHTPSLTGYNYASAGCGILPETGPANCMNLTEQVRLFGLTKETVLRPAFEDETSLNNHLANSIFFLWVGNNDYLLNYFMPNSSSSSDYTPEEYATLLTQRLSEKIQVLHSLGARKIVVFEGPPFGCIPFYYAKDGECNQEKNTNARLYNAKLQQMIITLSSEFSNAYFSLGKAYDLTYDAILNPSNYGLRNVTGPCCKPETGLVQCRLWGNKCANRSEYLFWDNAHPTEAGHGILGGQCITDSSVCSPYSITDLAHVTVDTSSSLLSAA